MALQDGNIIIGTSVDMKGMNTGLKKISKSVDHLGKKISTIFGLGGLGVTAALVALGKASLDAASDLQEVQNVVDVSFTKLDEAGNIVSDMTWKVEAFANTCVENFGMSRLAAKQTAGSFMAMGKSMGLTMEEASDMSVKLTGLTGDFASFYNISQDYARVALSAVYTGETETLKRYGIVLTEANLQQFALSQGIEGNVKKMDARDKAILRYMYILQATKDMEGDFIRTQDSWANQTRLLHQVWQEFLITLGSGLISVLTPVVKALSAIVQQLTLFVQRLWIILSGIFGFELQDLSKQASGITDGLGEMNEEVEDLGDNATKTGKKIHKQLANFDELNNIVTSTNSGSSASGGGGLSMPATDLGLSDLGGAGIDDFMDNLPKTLRELGKYIGDSISNMLDNIDWDSIYEKARRFGTGLADFLNGLFVDTDLFKSVGHTIASALNTAIYAALSFSDTFEWSNFGKKLAEGVNEFFATFDFESFAETLNSIVTGVWDMIVGFITELDYGEIFSGLLKFIKTLDPETLGVLIGLVFFKSTLFKALLGTFTAAFSEAFAAAMGAETVKAAIENFGTSVGTALGGAISKAAPWLMVIAGIGIAITEIVDMWNEGWSSLKAIFEAIGLALVAIGAVMLGVVSGPIAALIAGIVWAVSQIVIIIHEHWDEIVEWAGHVWVVIKDWFNKLIASVASTVLSMIEKWNNFKAAVSAVFDLIKTVIQDKLNSIKTSINVILTAIKATWTNAWNGLKTTVINIFNGIWSSIKGVINNILRGIEFMANGIVKGVNKVIQTLNNLQIDIPDNPLTGAVSIGFNIPYMSQVSIPRLAKGAVIPPNHEFMAMLGDQKSGTNIEAPLDTIKQAMYDVMAQYNGGSGDIVVQIDGREVFRAVRKQSQIFNKSTGLAAFS